MTSFFKLDGLGFLLLLISSNILLTLGEVDAQAPPNILFIVADDLNTRIGSYMDVEAHTPNLNRLAKEGVQFSRAYAQYPICGPSRASFMAGLYPQTTEVLTLQHVKGSYRGSNPKLADHPSMAGFFRKQGYFTARVSKIFHMGVPGGIERGAAGDDDPDSWDYAYNIMGPETLSPGKLELLSPKNLHYGSNFSRMILKDGTDHTQTDYMATTQAIALLESRAHPVADRATNLVKLKPQAPFFIGVGLVRPHVPFIAPERAFAPYPDSLMGVPSTSVDPSVPKEALFMQNEKIWGMNHTQKQKTIAAYLASVQYMDEQVGRLLDALDRLDLRKNTIVVFVSDHGYNLGEHNSWSKVSLWEGSVRVPLIISVPGVELPQGIKCDTITELVDLYPTLTDLCGLSDKAPAVLQGKTLVPLMDGSSAHKEKHFAYSITKQGKGATIRSARWRYTRWGEKAIPTQEELYDHLNDPEENHNLAKLPAHQLTIQQMRKQLDLFQEKAKTALD